MARSDGRPENQHYVPKMLLRNFAFGKQGHEQLFVYDKHAEKSWPTSIKNIAAERGFYEIEIGEGLVASIEQPLAVIEQQTQQTFRKVLEEQDLSKLSAEERAWIAIFVAVQKMRSKHARESMIEMDEALKRRIVKMGGDPNNVQNWRPFQDENEVKLFSMEFLRRHLKEFAGMLAFKHMILFSTTNADPFWISDNPVAMHNDNDMRPYGNLGLAVKGVQIYLPLSPTLALALWCPSLLDEVRQRCDQLHNDIATLHVQLALRPGINRNQVEAALRSRRELRLQLQELVRAFDAGRPAIFQPANVEFFNSLQVTWSHRFVMSRYQDFSLAKRMIRDKPKFKRGLSMFHN
jgi:hypothetical protein